MPDLRKGIKVGFLNVAGLDIMKLNLLIKEIKLVKISAVMLAECGICNYVKLEKEANRLGYKLIGPKNFEGNME